MGSRNDRKMDTTLGELIEAVSEVAFEYSDDAREAYLLARLTLVAILKNRSFAPGPAGVVTPISKLLEKELLH